MDKEKRHDLNEFHEAITESFDINIQEKAFPSYFFRSYFEGKRKFELQEITEYKKFDDSWIKAIELYFPSIYRITQDLKSTLRYQSEVVPVEKAKKVSKDSVVHLSSHSNFLREQEGEIVPLKILTSLAEIDYGIYENRFIMTLIYRLRDFMNKRIKIIKESLDATKKTNMHINSDFNYEGTNYNINLEILGDKVFAVEDNQNEQLLERAEALLKMINKLYNSSFMKVMKSYKKVVPPIMKTQIILKNPNFKNAYLLWLYLDKYNELNYTHMLENQRRNFSQLYNKHINQALLLFFSTLLVHDKANGIDKNNYGKVKYIETKAEQVSTDLELQSYNNYVVEGNIYNEYFIDKNIQIMKREFDNYLEKGNDFFEALEKSLNESLKIVNGIYESMFEFNADADIFERLIKGNDAEETFNSACHKYEIAKTVRKVKEKDYKQAVLLEKKWQKELITRQQEYIKFLEKQVQIDNAAKIKEVSDKYTSTKRMEDNRLNKRKEGLENLTKKEINSFKRKLEDQLIVKKARIKEKEKEKLDKQMKYWNDKLERERKRYNAELEKINKKNQEKERKAKEKLKAEHNKKLQKLEKDSDVRANKQMIKTETQAKKQIEKLQKK